MAQLIAAAASAAAAATPFPAALTPRAYRP